MAFISVRCPYCHSDQIVKRGKTGCGTQRYLCQNATCATGSFLLAYRYQGRLPAVKHPIMAMSLNASGVRDTARVLRISTDTVLSELKKKSSRAGIGQHRVPAHPQPRQCGDHRACWGSRDGG